MSSNLPPGVTDNMIEEQAGPTGYMRPCENCEGSGTIFDGYYHHTCAECGGTGIYDASDSPGAADGLAGVVSSSGDVNEPWKPFQIVTSQGRLLFRCGTPQEVEQLLVGNPTFTPTTGTYVQQANGMHRCHWRGWLNFYDDFKPFLKAVVS